jgi:hypothetical protein
MKKAIPEEVAQRRFNIVFESLKGQYPGECLYYSVLDERYVVAEDSQAAANLYTQKYGALKEGQYREVISNIFPKT